MRQKAPPTRKKPFNIENHSYIKGYCCIGTIAVDPHRSVCIKRAFNVDGLSKGDGAFAMDDLPPDTLLGTYGGFVSVATINDEIVNPFPDVHPPSHSIKTTAVHIPTSEEVVAIIDPLSKWNVIDPQFEKCKMHVLNEPGPLQPLNCCYECGPPVKVGDYMVKTIRVMTLPEDVINAGAELCVCYSQDPEFERNYAVPSFWR